MIQPAERPADGGGSDPRASFVADFDVLAARARRVCEGVLGPGPDAQDATQEALLRAWVHAGAVATDMTAYVTATARNVSRNLLERQRLRTTTPLDALPLPSTAPDPAQMAADRLFISSLWQGLTPRERRLLFYDVSGLRAGEIATATGTTWSTVTSSLSRARRRARSVCAAMRAILVVPGGLAARWQSRLRSPSREGAAQMGAMPVIAGAVIACLGLSGELHGSQAQPPPVAGVTRQAPVSGAPPGVVARTGANAGQVTAEIPSARPTASPSHRTTISPSDGLLSPPTVDDGEFQWFTPSPGYQQDHTVFAAGWRTNGCPLCPLLFVSHDSGRTWQPRPAIGYLQGAILLPPDFPSNPTLFTLTAQGMQRSDDAGATFRLVLPGAYNGAVVAQGERPGDARVELWSSAGLITYDQSSGLASPYLGLPAGTAPDTIADLGLSSGFLALVSSATAGTGLGAPGALPAGTEELVQCAQTCTPLGRLHLPAGESVRSMHVSPSFASDRTLVVDTYGTPQTLFVSRDGGAGFASLRLPDGMVEIGVDYGAHGPLVLASRFVNGALESLVLCVDATAMTVVTEGSVAVPNVASGFLVSIAAMPDGHLLAGLASQGTAQRVGGIGRSPDGVTWVRSG